jgi:hypothetical protein
MMALVKRWAFYPLLFLLCVAAGNALIDKNHPSLTGWAIGVAASIPLAVIWDGRRRRRGHTR